MPARRAPGTERTLSAREKSIACLFALGYDRNYIADEVGCAVKTVDSHRLKILAKLELDSTVALCRYAIEHSWVPVPGGMLTCEELMEHYRPPVDDC